MFSQALLHVSHSMSSHFWGSCVIYSMWACGCDYTVWIFRRITASRNYSMTVRWVTLDKTAFLPTLHAEQKPLQSFYSYSDGAIGHWLLSCNLFSANRGNHWQLLPLLLSHSFIKNLQPAPHEPPRETSNIVWYLCAAACKQKFSNQWPSYFNCTQTQSGKNRIK